jgi:hypothetical protein
LISYYGTTARCSLTNQLHQRMPPSMLFLLTQKSPAERVTLERIAVQIFGKVPKP